jgi:hypothetical protein
MRASQSARRLGAIVAIAGAAVALAASCGGAGDELGGPPKPLTSAATGTGGGGGASTSSSATGGGYSCGCVAAMASQPCANCYNQAISDHGGCVPETLACQSDPTCIAAFACLNACDFDAACLPKCFASADPAGLATLVSLFDCTCAACADACAPVDGAVCEGTGGGGAGGHGGATGSGGAGGATGAGGAGGAGGHGGAGGQGTGRGAGGDGGSGG